MSKLPVAGGGGGGGAPEYIVIASEGANEQPFALMEPYLVLVNEPTLYGFRIAPEYLDKVVSVSGSALDPSDSYGSVSRYFDYDYKTNKSRKVGDYGYTYTINDARKNGIACCGSKGTFRLVVSTKSLQI